MGDLNPRVGYSDRHLKAVGRYAYHQVSKDNDNRLIDHCEANNMCIATTRKPHPKIHQRRWQHSNGNKAQLGNVILRRESGSIHFKIVAAATLLKLIQITAVLQLL